MHPQLTLNFPAVPRDTTLHDLLLGALTDDRDKDDIATPRDCQFCQKAPERTRIKALPLAPLRAEVAGLHEKFKKLHLAMPEASATYEQLMHARLNLLERAEAPKTAPKVLSPLAVTVKLDKPLSTIVLSLARFSFSRRGAGGVQEQKLSVEVTFPLDLNLQRYMVDGSAACNYKLVGVLEHVGLSVFFGHWMAYRLGSADGKWRCFDDSSVTEIAEADVLAKRKGVVALRYERIA
jgi:hypothetical protein